MFSLFHNCNCIEKVIDVDLHWFDLKTIYLYFKIGHEHKKTILIFQATFLYRWRNLNSISFSFFHENIISEFGISDRFSKEKDENWECLMLPIPIQCGRKDFWKYIHSIYLFRKKRRKYIHWYDFAVGTMLPHIFFLFPLQHRHRRLSLRANGRFFSSLEFMNFPSKMNL